MRQCRCGYGEATPDHPNIALQIHETHKPTWLMTMKGVGSVVRSMINSYLTVFRCEFSIILMSFDMSVFLFIGVFNFTMVMSS